MENPPANGGDSGSIPGWGRSPGGGHGNPLQYSCLENPRDRGAWQADTTEWLSPHASCWQHVLQVLQPWVGRDSCRDLVFSSFVLCFPLFSPPWHLFMLYLWDRLRFPPCVVLSRHWQSATQRVRDLYLQFLAIAFWELMLLFLEMFT